MFIKRCRRRLNFQFLITYCFILMGIAWAFQGYAATQNFSPRALKTQLSEAPINVLDAASTLTIPESLTYDVYWMGFHVGYGTLELKDSQEPGLEDCYHVRATARTNQVLSAIYPVEDQIDSFFDKKTFQVRKFIKNVKERRYKAYEAITYDLNTSKASYQSFTNGSKKEFTLPSNTVTHDMISVFYKFRTQNLKRPGQVWTAIVNDEDKNWDFSVDILSLEKKFLSGHGLVDTLIVEPKTKLKGALYSRGRAWVYLNTNAARVPVWIVLSTPYGRVYGVLRKEGLR